MLIVYCEKRRELEATSCRRRTMRLHALTLRIALLGLVLLASACTSSTPDDESAVRDESSVSTEATSTTAVESATASPSSTATTNASTSTTSTTSTDAPTTSSSTTTGATTSVPPTTTAARRVDDVAVACSDVAEITSDLQGGSSGPGAVPGGVRIPIDNYGKANPDTYAGLWLDRSRGTKLVVAFTGDLTPHREAIFGVEGPLVGNEDVVVALVSATYSFAELEAAQQSMTSFFGAPDIGLSGSGIRTSQNIVTASLLDPTPDGLATFTAAIVGLPVCISVSQSPEPVRSMPSVIPAAGADPLVSCFQDIPFRLSALTNPQPLPLDHSLNELAGEISVADNKPFVPADWSILVETQTDLLTLRPSDGSILRYEAGNPWTFFNGGGGCNPRVVLPSPLRTVEWELDPAFPASTPDTTVIHVLAAERGCASGRAMGDRLLGPEVVERDDEVLIAFATNPPPGLNQNCPGNPSTPVTVELSAPLGTREVKDGLATGVGVGE